MILTIPMHPPHSPRVNAMIDCSPSRAVNPDGWMQTGPRPGPTARVALLLLLAVLGLGMAAPSAARAASSGQSGPQLDPRRAHSGAKVTAETAPAERDEKKASDDSERTHDSYQPKGIELGPFLFLPKIDTDLIYNSNFYASQKDPKAELTTVVRPELKFRSRFDEHAINMALLVEQYLNKTYSHDDRLDLDFNIDGRYDYSDNLQVTSFIDLYSRHEERGSPNDAGGREPTPTQGLMGKLGFRQLLGKYLVGGDFTTQRMLYDDVQTSIGTPIVNTDRNRSEWDGRLRTGYEFFPGYAAIVDIGANTRQYDQEYDRNGYARSSFGGRLEAGVAVDLSQLIRGDFLVGYLYQNYQDARFEDPSGISLRASFNWTPTTLTIVVPTLERTVTETTTLGASAMIRNGGSLLVRHELERNIILTGFTSAYYDQYATLNQTSWSYEARFRAIYAFMPEFYIGPEIAERIKDSEMDGSSYTQTLLLFRIGFRL
jgi:hypothetical protein